MSRAADVAVVLNVWNIPVVLKFAPLDVAFRYMELKYTPIEEVAVVLVRLIPRTRSVAESAAGALRSLIKLL